MLIAAGSIQSLYFTVRTNQHCSKHLVNMELEVRRGKAGLQWKDIKL